MLRYFAIFPKIFHSPYKEGKLFTAIPDLFPGLSALLSVVQLLAAALLVVALTLNTLVTVQFRMDLKILEVQSQVLTEKPLNRKGHFGQVPGHQEESSQLTHQGQPEVLQHKKKVKSYS